jgi:hypothetical protein
MPVNPECFRRRPAPLKNSVRFFIIKVGLCKRHRPVAFVFQPSAIHATAASFSADSDAHGRTGLSREGNLNWGEVVMVSKN